MTYEAKTYWEQRGQNYRQEREQNPDGDWVEINRFILSWIKKLNPQKILDFGCGYGKMLSILPEKLELSGLDISQSQIENAKIFLKDRKAELICADILQWTTDRKWDLGITRRFLIHLSPEEIRMALPKIKNLCTNLLILESYVSDAKQDGYWTHDYKNIFKELDMKFEILNEEDIERRYLCG